MAIVGNTSADFSPESLVQISKTAEQYDELQQMISLRRNMGPSAITKLKRLAEGDFWHQMAETILMTSEEPDKRIIAKPKSPKVVEKNELAGRKETKANKPTKNEPIKAVKEADETVLVEYSRSGKVEDSIEAFTNITQLDKAMVEHCLFQAHISALMVLCKAHGCAPGTFTALLHLRETITGEPTTDTIGLMRRYEGMTADTAKRIINFSDKRPNATKEAKTASAF